MKIGISAQFLQEGIEPRLDPVFNKAWGITEFMVI